MSVAVPCECRVRLPVWVAWLTDRPAALLGSASLRFASLCSPIDPPQRSFDPPPRPPFQPPLPLLSSPLLSSRSDGVSAFRRSSAQAGRNSGRTQHRRSLYDQQKQSSERRQSIIAPGLLAGAAHSDWDVLLTPCVGCAVLASRVCRGRRSRAGRTGGADQRAGHGAAQWTVRGKTHAQRRGKAKGKDRRGCAQQGLQAKGSAIAIHCSLRSSLSPLALPPPPFPSSPHLSPPAFACSTTTSA